MRHLSQLHTDEAHQLVWELLSNHLGTCSMSLPNMTPFSGKSDNLSGYMLDDHSWDTLDNLPGYGLMSTLGKVGQLAQYVLNDHSQKKSDNLTGYGLNESPQ